MKTKVIFDFQAFFNKYGGVSRYYAEIIKEMKKSGYPIKIGAVGSYNYYLNQQHLIPVIPEWTRNFNLLKKGIPYVDRKLIEELVKSNPDAIFHATYYDPYLLDMSPKKVTCTVYDMILERYPDFFPNSKRDVENKKRYIYESSHIFSISQKTKEDIILFYPDIPEDKITVTYLSTNMKRQDSYANFTRNNDDYILFVGTRSTYKNFYVLLKALSILVRRGDMIQLICVGGGSFNEDEENNIKTLGLQDYVFQKTMSDEELAEYYANAKCFVFPSLYEGFGIPILEAFACGCPTIVSDSSCFPEIAGEAALYFEPNDEHDLAMKIYECLHNCSETEKYVEKGYDRLKFFSWEKSATKMMEVYDEIYKLNTQQN